MILLRLLKLMNNLPQIGISTFNKTEVYVDSIGNNEQKNEGET